MDPRRDDFHLKGNSTALNPGFVPLRSAALVQELGMKNGVLIGPWVQVRRCSCEWVAVETRGLAPQPQRLKSIV